MNTKLFTVFYEYNGGTYIRQIEAANPADSVKNSLLALATVLKVGEEDLKEAIVGENILLVEECHNVWCITGLLNDALLLINIVETAAASPGSARDYSFNE